MISYKTLVIITVMFSIVICNECEEREEREECEEREEWEDCQDCQECEKCEEFKKLKKCQDTLLSFGFDSEIGLYNYSFVKQFEDYEKFKNHILKYTKENGYLKAIYDAIQKEKKPIEEMYLSPEKFCEQLTLQNNNDEFIEILKTSKDKRVVELINNIGKIIVENCKTSILKYVYRVEADNRSTQYDDLNPYKNVLVSFDIAKIKHITVSDNVLLRKLEVKYVLETLEELPEVKQIPIKYVLKKLEEVPDFKQFPKYVFTYFSSHIYLAKTTISAYEKFKPSALCKNYFKEDNTLKIGEDNTLKEEEDNNTLKEEDNR